MDILDLTAGELVKKTKNRELRPQEILDAYFKQIDATEPAIDAYLAVLKERAYRKAQDLEKKLMGAAPEENGLRLCGLPLAVKDNIMIEDVPTTCGAKILENYQAPYSATVIKRLENEGALILGKTNMDEFAMGSSTEHSAFKTTKNPWNTECVPGGSSGGSAASIAAGSALAALGSDTGGSIRQPAAFCGITGLKPTYGFVSRYGLTAFASSLDQIGPMARDGGDSALLFDVLCAHDSNDATSLPQANCPRRDQFQRKILGLPKEFFGHDSLDADVSAALERAMKIFESSGWRLKEISLPHVRYALAAYYILAPAEASANLARFDGIRYGKRSDGEHLLDLYKNSRTQGLGEEVQRRILIGTFALSHGYYEAYYGQAQKARRRIRQDFLKAFTETDCVLSPTTPTPAFKVGAKTKDPVAMYLMDIFTLAVNLAGVPAISAPCGLSRDNLPIGMQLIGPHGSDFDLIETISGFEKASGKAYVQKNPARKARARCGRAAGGASGTSGTGGADPAAGGSPGSVADGHAVHAQEVNDG